jgi:peptidoglycan/LPS O-acetylase OafA/YrhL
VVELDQLVHIGGLSLVGASQQFFYFGGFTLVAMASGFLVLRSIDKPPVILTSRGLLWIGKRAYGLYIWHYPIFLLAGRIAPGLVGAFVAVPILFAFAFLSYRYIESPFLKMKRKYQLDPNHSPVGSVVAAGRLSERQ